MPGLGLGLAQISGKRIIEDDDALSYADALLSEASLSAKVWLEGPLGKDHPTVGNPLGKDLSDAQQMPTTQGNAACSDGVAKKG